MIEEDYYYHISAATKIAHSYIIERLQSPAQAIVNAIKIRSDQLSEIDLALSDLMESERKLHSNWGSF